MFLALKRNPVWLDSLSRCSLNETPARLVGEDGCQVSVPAAILLAASPLVRSISSTGLHPVVCPIALSVPTTVSGDVLGAAVEIMTKGSAKLNVDNIVNIKEVFRLLEIESVLNSNKFEMISYWRESKMDLQEVQMKTEK